MHDYYISELVSEWGMSKTIQIVMFSLAGACLISAICVKMLPDKPTEFILPKDKEIEENEERYYDQFSQSFS